MEEKKNTIENKTFLAKWLEGTVLDTELKNLVSEKDFIAYKKIRKGLVVLEEFKRSLKPSFDRLQNKINQNQKEKLKRQNIRWGISIAASLLILFGLFSVFSSQDTIIETLVAEQKIVQLLDGSEVILNAKSMISYSENEWKNKREVNLIGEAFFKVKKGSTFTVRTQNGTIRVLGTQFNVIASDDFFQVTCFEGKVMVTNNKIDYMLTPSNSFRKINGNSVEEIEVNTKSPTWIDGESSFKSVPLKYVILTLEKQYDIEIDASNINDSLVYTGSFSNKEVDVALASVFKPMKIKYQKKKKKKKKIVKLEFE